MFQNRAVFWLKIPQSRYLIQGPGTVCPGNLPILAAYAPTKGSMGYGEVAFMPEACLAGYLRST